VALEPASVLAHVRSLWDTDILSALEEYIRVPARSPAFDPAWAAHGHLDRAVGLMETWARKRPLRGCTAEVVRLPGRTPLLLVETPGEAAGTVLLYGHCDKQPEMTGWAEGLAPWTPVRRGDRLYGRGAADDGYAVFAALAALETLQRHRTPHARCLVLVEASEESGSPDLPAYLDVLADRLGTPDLVLCLDSACADWVHLWVTTSLRGLVNGVLEVEVLTEGVHSGASGVVPSSFRLARQLLSRLEDEQTGMVKPAALRVEIPEERRAEARAEVEVLGHAVYARYPLVPGLRPPRDDLVELLLDGTWRAALEVTGAEGLPPLADAGNVLRPRTALKLSLRLPPTLPAREAAEVVRALLEGDPPYGARVRFRVETLSEGWNAPPLPAWLRGSLELAARAYFGRPLQFTGAGGTIPFVRMLGERFPQVPCVVTGVLGPGANAHGPNEFLHLPTAVRLTAAVAQVLADHARAAR
jgi:acetylornithine deacetylase/succinyl-diaminopimelate desuccinylase-like protein